MLVKIHLTFAGNINRQNLEMADIERSIRHMQNDMIKLNKLIHKEKGIQMDLSQNNVLMENDFVGSLKVSIVLLLFVSIHVLLSCSLQLTWHA